MSDVGVIIRFFLLDNDNKNVIVCIVLLRFILLVNILLNL